MAVGDLAWAWYQFLGFLLSRNVVLDKQACVPVGKPADSLWHLSCAQDQAGPWPPEAVCQFCTWEHSGVITQHPPELSA